MKFKNFFAGIIQIPFHSKAFDWFSFHSLFLFLSRRCGSGNDDIQQADPEDTRQLIKQAEKLARRGEMAEAEKILRRVLQNKSERIKSKTYTRVIFCSNSDDSSKRTNLSFEVAKAEPKNSYAFAVLGDQLC